MKKLLLIAIISILSLTKIMANPGAEVELIMEEDVKRFTLLQISYWDPNDSKHGLHIGGCKASDYILLYPSYRLHRHINFEGPAKEYFIDCLVLKDPSTNELAFRETSKVTFEANHLYHFIFEQEKDSTTGENSY